MVLNSISNVILSSTLISRASDGFFKSKVTKSVVVVARPLTMSFAIALDVARSAIAERIAPTATASSVVPAVSYELSSLPQPQPDMFESILADLKFAPFFLLATEGKLYFDRTHEWHMNTLAELPSSPSPLAGEGGRREGVSRRSRRKHNRRPGEG